MKSYEYRGEAIRERREALGWSQNELSVQLRIREGLTVSAQTLGRYELGRSSMDAADLPKYCRVLDMDLVDFYEQVQVAA